MINWLYLLANSLWILALALVLTGLGITRWETKTGPGSWKELLNQSSRVILFNLAGLLFCLGLALAAQAWWERALWIVLVILFGIRIYCDQGTRGLGDGETGD